MIQIEEKTAYCASRHLLTFHSQAVKEKCADFGEPCKDCRYYAECKGDFLRTLSDLMVEDRFKIAMQEEIC